MNLDTSTRLSDALEDLHRLREECIRQLPLTEQDAQDIDHRLDLIQKHLEELVEEEPRVQELEHLSDIALLLAHAVDTRQVLRAILDGLKTAVPYDAGGIFLVGESRDDIYAQVLRGYPQESLANVRQKVTEGIIGWVIQHGDSIIVDDVLQDTRYICALESTKSELAVPVVSGDEVIGSINLESNQPAAFNLRMLRHVQALAYHAAVAIERTRMHDSLVAARQLERELQIARSIQVALLPKRPPQLPGYDIAGINIPSHEVGGDYFDYIPIQTDQLGLIIADVAGKGVPAGLIMSGFRAALRTRVETTFSIRHILFEVNRFLYDSTGPESFVTAFYSVLSTSDHKLTYSNSGHNPPMLLHADGRMVRLIAGGPLLGVLRDTTYDHAIAELEPGAVLVMFTDGIVESTNAAGEEFDDARVEQIVRNMASEPADVIALELEQQAAQWCAEASEMDDRTVIVVKRI